MIPFKHRVRLLWPLVVLLPVILWFALGKDSPLPARDAGRGAETAARPEDSGDGLGVDATPPAEDPATAGGRLTLETHRLGPGRTMTEVLSSVGLPTATRVSVLDAVAEVLDLRRLSPETGIVVSRNGNGEVERLAIRAEPARFVRLRLAEPDGEPGLDVFELPLQTTVETAGGRVSTSVSQALEDSPRRDRLTLAFADIFQWDVDLLVDPRPGDRVSVVYEVQRLAEVPADLPSFGNAPGERGQFLRLGRIVAAVYDGRMASSVAFWVEGPDGDGGYYDTEGQALQKTFLKSPLNYRRISSRFSRARLNPVTRRVVPHHGVDFAAAAGTPVVAAADGRVVSSGWAGPLGRAIRIRHGSEYETVYGHLSRVARGLGPGDAVQQNQLIGYVGSTGRATGPHLHYTMIRRGQPIDPMKFINPPAEPLAQELWPRLERAKSSWSDLLESTGSSVELVASAAEPRPGV